MTTQPPHSAERPTPTSTLPRPALRPGMAARTPASTPALRAIRARRLMLWSLPALVVMVLFASKVALNEFHYGTGNSAYQDENYATALDRFSGNQDLNVWQRWIAPFNVGDAQFGAGDLDGAIASFEQSLTTVPQSQECTVRINLATVHETQGDALQESGDTAGARGAWQVARKVLADGNCPTEAGQGQQQSSEAQTQDQRLADKLGEEQTPGQSPTPSPGDSGEPSDGEGTDPDQGQLDQLDQLNELGQDSRQQNEDLQERPNRDWGYHW